MARVVQLPPEDTPTVDGIRLAGWWRDADQGPAAPLRTLPARLPASAGHARLLLRPRKPRRPDGLDHLRPQHRLLRRSDREETAEPFLSGHVGALVRHGGLQPGLQVLPELDHLEVARRRGRLRSRPRPRPSPQAAVRLGCRSVAFTYNDPIVWAEYAIDTATACHAAGIKTVAVTSGYMNPDAREAFYEHIDAANVDLKGFSEDFYRTLTGGRLEPVLDTLRWLARRGSIWLEITNLSFRGANDSPDEIERMCRWIVDELGPDVPLHFSAFHPDFKLSRPRADAAGDARRGLRHRPPLRPALRLHRQRQRPRAPGDLLSRLRPGGDRARRLRAAATTTFAKAAARTATGRLPAGSTTRPGDWGGRRMPVRIGQIVAAQPTPADGGPAGAPSLSDGARAAGVPGGGPARGGRRAVAARSGHGRHPGRNRRHARLRQLRQPQARRATPLLLRFPRLPRRRWARRWTTRPSGRPRDDPRFPPIAADELDEPATWKSGCCGGSQPVAARDATASGPSRSASTACRSPAGQARGLLLPGVAVEHHLDARGFCSRCA